MLGETKELSLLWIMPLDLGESPGVDGRCVDCHEIRSWMRRLSARADGWMRRVLDICGQATKGAWGMPWRQKAMKGVEDCEKLGVAVKQALIPRYPN